MNVAPFPTYCICILHLHSLESLCCDAACVCMGPGPFDLRITKVNPVFFSAVKCGASMERKMHWSME